MAQSDYDTLIKMSEKLREKDVTRKRQLIDIANFMKHVPPEPPVQRFDTRDRITTPSVPVRRRVVESLSCAAAESTPRKTKFEINKEEDYVEEEVVRTSANKRVRI